jgi:hypothetical protein
LSFGAHFIAVFFRRIQWQEPAQVMAKLPSIGRSVFRKERRGVDMAQDSGPKSPFSALSRPNRTIARFTSKIGDDYRV